MGFHGLSFLRTTTMTATKTTTTTSTIHIWGGFPQKSFPHIFPASFPIPKTKITPWRDKWDLSTLVIKNTCKSHPWRCAECPMLAPLGKGWEKKTPRPQNGSYQYLKGPSSYFCPRGIYTLPDFRKLKGETSTNKQKFKNSGSWSTGFMQNSSPGTPHPTNYLRRFYSVAQKNGQNGWHSWW